MFFGGWTPWKGTLNAVPSHIIPQMPKVDEVRQIHRHEMEPPFSVDVIICFDFLSLPLPPIRYCCASPSYKYWKISQISFLFSLFDCSKFPTGYPPPPFVVGSQNSPHSTSSLALNATSSDWKHRKTITRSIQGATTPDMHSRRHSGMLKAVSFYLETSSFTINKQKTLFYSIRRR